MTSAIPEPREDVGENAPKILSFEIPVEKIGEVIGPKGKMINTIQAETGAEITVDDDGMSGIVSIASPDREKVAEAERQVMLIVDPPSAHVGEVYEGRVVNITKFGAFVNILPGRDGLVHISKLGGGKRMRPLFACASCEAFGGDVEPALTSGCALEFIHSYSLIHDDLPAMDDDDIRHGKPATHIAYGEANAILAGDSLHSLAFQAVVDCDTIDAHSKLSIIQLLSDAAGWAGMEVGPRRGGGRKN